MSGAEEGVSDGPVRTECETEAPPIWEMIAFARPKRLKPANEARFPSHSYSFPTEEIFPIPQGPADNLRCSGQGFCKMATSY